MRPSYLPAISDLIRFYKWKSIIYLYDSDDGKAGRKLFVNKILHLFYSNFLRKYFARESKEVKWVYRLQNEFDYYLFKSLFLISTWWWYQATTCVEYLSILTNIVRLLNLKVYIEGK